MEEGGCGPSRVGSFMPLWPQTARIEDGAFERGHTSSAHQGVAENKVATERITRGARASSDGMYPTSFQQAILWLVEFHLVKDSQSSCPEASGRKGTDV